MRTLIPAIAAAVSLLAALSSHAADITPGLWEITLESRVADSPGFAPPAAKSTQCFTPQDAKDPSRIVGQVATPGATGCDYTERNYTGNTFTFAMKCSGTFALVSSGKVTFSGTTMDGNITAKANMAGQNVEMQNKISARRIGGC